MNIVCLDLEGVLVPEIWIAVAKKSRVDDLLLTTRDIPDYDALMRRRIKLLRQHRIRLTDIQSVISTIQPLPGAKAFLQTLRKKEQVVILSDTFYEFAMPLMEKLGYPALWCNRLSADKPGYVSGYELRQKNGKEKAVRAIQNAGFHVRAAGDSYNDIGMLKAADYGVLFNPPSKITKEFPRFKVAKSYSQLLNALTNGA